MQLYKIMCQKLIKDKSLNKIYQTIEIHPMDESSADARVERAIEATLA